MKEYNDIVNSVKLLMLNPIVANNTKFNDIAAK